MSVDQEELEALAQERPGVAWPRWGVVVRQMVIALFSKGVPNA